MWLYKVATDFVHVVSLWNCEDHPVGTNRYLVDFTQVRQRDKNCMIVFFKYKKPLSN